MLSAYIHGVGVVGPGLTDWPSAARILRGEVDYRRAATLLPAADALPPAERRRAGRVIRLALGVGAEAVAAAGADPRTLASVFSSSSGDGDNCHEICVTLAGSERLLSPTRFHNSVHNASSGYWGIAYGCPEPSTALCAHDASFGAGLLEGLAQMARNGGAVLLVAYDLDYPAPMRSKRPVPDAFGVSLVLAATPGAHPRPRLRVAFTRQAATPLAHAALEALRREIPAARALPLLERLAHGAHGSVVLDYLDQRRLEVALEAPA